MAPIFWKSALEKLSSAYFVGYILWVPGYQKLVVFVVLGFAGTRVPPGVIPTKHGPGKVET